VFLLKPGIKENPLRRWNLPDRMFFARGACHILAHAFPERFASAGFGPIWIRPRDGFTGNHVFVTNGDLAFDYHGYGPGPASSITTRSGRGGSSRDGKPIWWR
jgi:hypothetical protein